MSDRRKRSFAALVASIALAASGLAATPAPAQTWPGAYGSCQYDPGSGNWYRMYVSHWEPCDPNDDCQYDPWSGNWYRMYVSHWELCEPYGQSSNEPDDRASKEAAEPAGK